MRYGFVARLQVLIAALLVIGASLSMLAAEASAGTYVASSTTQFVEAVSKANANPGANTIVLSGGVYLPTSTLTFTNTSGLQTVEGPTSLPTAKLEGGAVEPFPSSLFVLEANAKVTFKNVEIAHAGGAGAPAIDDFGTLGIESSTVAGNVGVGVHVELGGSATVRNSTLSDGLSFGIVDHGTVSLFNSTVAFNENGGIENSGTLNLTNTIVADNHGSGDCAGAANTSDHSLDSDGSCGVGALSKTNPLLQTRLVNDGGSTPLHALEPGSPAIGAGDAATCTTTDQRGAQRADRCSIGAFEVCTAEGFCASFTHDEAKGLPFGEPTAVAVGPSGNLYVADGSRFHDRILEFNAKHEYLRQFGSAGSGNGQFNEIGGIAVSQSTGDLYVTGNNRVQEFSPSGEYLGKFGEFGSGNGQLWYPTGIALDSSGDVWVLDSSNYRVEEFSSSGAYLGQFGERGSGAGKLGWAFGLAVSGGNLYVSEIENSRVQEFSSSGKYERAFDEKGSGKGKSNVPWRIAADPGTGDLYVVEGASILAGAEANRVQEFSPEGAFVTTFGSSGLGNGQLAGARGVAVGSSGQVFVADSGNKRIDEWVLP